MVLRCIYKTETEEQTLSNLIWERKFRNRTIRKALPDTAVLCTYPVDDIIEILNGNSLLYSAWMAKLLELYDGVIYANQDWTGAAFDFVELFI